MTDLVTEERDRRVPGGVWRERHDGVWALSLCKLLAAPAGGAVKLSNLPAIDLLTIGRSAFEGCVALSTWTWGGAGVPDGPVGNVTLRENSFANTGFWTISFAVPRFNHLNLRVHCGAFGNISRLNMVDFSGLKELCSWMAPAGHSESTSAPRVLTPARYSRALAPL